MDKIIQPIELTAQPTALGPCFDVLTATDGDAPIALFGGAVRDADYAAYHGEPRPVNDYDLRVLLPDEDHDARVREFVVKLGRVARSTIREVPSRHRQYPLLPQLPRRRDGRQHSSAQLFDGCECGY